MKKQTAKSVIFICLILGLVIAGTAFTGIFFRGESKSVEVTSVRGENYTIIQDGIYQFNSQRMVAEGVGWDIFTLFIALPLFFILMPFLYRNSLRAKLLVTAYLTWKKNPWGYLLSPVLMVKAVAMAGAICAMLISAWIVEEKSQLVNLVIFGGVLSASGHLGYRMLRRA